MGCGAGTRGSAASPSAPAAAPGTPTALGRVHRSRVRDRDRRPVSLCPLAPRSPAEQRSSPSLSFSQASTLSRELARADRAGALPEGRIRVHGPWGQKGTLSSPAHGRGPAPAPQGATDLCSSGGPPGGTPAGAGEGIRPLALVMGAEAAHPAGKELRGLDLRDRGQLGGEGGRDTPAPSSSRWAPPDLEVVDVVLRVQVNPLRLLVDGHDGLTDVDGAVQLALEDLKSPGTPVRGKSLFLVGEMGSLPPCAHGEVARTQPILTSWRVVAYVRMPFSSTKYLWGQRGTIERGTEVDPRSPPTQGPESPQGWARRPRAAGLGSACAPAPLPCASP